MQNAMVLILIYSLLVFYSCANRTSKKSITKSIETNKVEVDIERIDDIIHILDSDPTIQKKVVDTALYVKEDGGTKSDSVYCHGEYWYRSGELVRIHEYGINGLWRRDQLAYYLKGKTIKYSEGETLVGSPEFGKLEFEIYYVGQSAVKIVSLNKKPENVLGLDTKSLLIKSFYLLQRAHGAGF